MPDKIDSSPAARPSVVVVMPFYNGADFIERAVKSVFNQTGLLEALPRRSLI